MDLHLEWLDAFVDFSERLNFTRTAEARGISQPALHAQIRKLADQLGQPLYRRRGRALELTYAGRQAAAFGRELRERGELFLADLRGRRADAPVVLAAGEGALLYLLGDALRRFRGRAGDASLRLLVRDGPAAIEALADGLAHVAIAPRGAAPPSADLELVAIAEVGQVLLLPQGHPLAERARIDLRDLAGTSLIVPPAGRPLRRTLADALAQAGVRWEVAVEAEGWPLIVHLASLGIGLAVVNDFCRAPRGMVAVPIPALPPVVYTAIRRRGAAPTPSAARLWRLLTGEG